ncbi:sodium:alanine symporter family protein [Clostridium botulinum CFSAN002369]|nr:sodium:alanine symporter family protein [Clostridium botulinum CFSAN002369]
MDGSFKCRERHKQCTMELCIDFLLCGAGVVFTVSLKFVQVSKFRESFKKAFGGMSLKGKKQVKME